MPTQDLPARKIAIGRQLRHCPSVLCLGARSNLAHYTSEERILIRRAPKIYFPTGLLAEPLAALGKPMYPSIQTHRFAGDKILQTRLFELLELPTPRTAIAYGPRQKSRIPEDFDLPLIAKVPRNSSRGLGVRLIRTREQLMFYLEQNTPAYIQEYLPLTRDLRVVIVGQRILNAYWREAPPGEFRNNVARGGRISFRDIPSAALDLALTTARWCGFDHVGMDICEHQDRHLILESNMTFGLEGFRAAGLDYPAILRTMVENEDI